MTPDIDGLKSYIGGLVLDVFAARGEAQELASQVKERAAKIAELELQVKSLKPSE